MVKQKIIEEFTARISEVLAASPAKDLEKNLKATLAALFTKLDLVTREEFDVQAQVLARTREQLSALEARLAKLEQASSDPRAGTGDPPTGDPPTAGSDA